MSSAPADVLSALAEAVSLHRRLALIGATARNVWAPPRATSDLDLAVASSQAALDRVEQVLKRLGYERVRSHRADPSDTLADLIVLRAPSGSLRQVDLLVAKTPFEAQVLQRAIPMDVGGVTLPVATLEDLIVYKLVADRARDREDINAVLRTQRRAGREIDWAHIERWADFWGVSERLADLLAR